MKQQEYQHHSERSFDVGDWVFLWLQPYKQMSLRQAKKDNKLSPNYYGPQGDAKHWYYEIQIGTSYIFPSSPSSPCLILK